MSTTQQAGSDDKSRVSLGRRQLLGAAAGTAAAITVAAGQSPAHAGPLGRESQGRGGVIPGSRRGLMAFTVRDLINNDKTKYPTLPSGWRETFEAAAAIGYTGIEFYSFYGIATFPQAAGAEGGASPTAAQIRRWLDDTGLEAIGHFNARILDPQTFEIEGLTPATIDIALESAATLGQAITGSSDATVQLRQKDDVDAVIDTWNEMAVKAAAAGIPIYTHAHDYPWDFLLDSGPKDADGNFTQSSGIRVMDYFLQNTDPDWIKCEFDIYWAHVAQNRYRSYTATDGSTVTDVFDPAAQVAKDPSRYPILHAKDGIQAPDTTEGWIFSPFGYGDIDMEGFRNDSRLKKSNPWWSVEQDNAPGTDADPSKSLRDVSNSYRGLSTLGTGRGGRNPFAGAPL